jgi:thermostable 8-oxoguanine DNA glycosylase
MKIKSAQNRLLAVVRLLATEKRLYLEDLKRNRSGLKRPDFIWHYLLQSFATMGKASGWEGFIKNQDNYQRVTFEALAALTPKMREKQVYEICRAAKVRMPDTKARYILECFQQVRSLGGPEKAKELLLAEPGRDSKIKFLRKLRGIGPKYSRNIMMDVYHKDFRESIAIDARIKSISKALRISFSDSEYSQHEAFYLEVAHLAGLNGWELDRLLFNFADEVKRRLGCKS